MPFGDTCNTGGRKFPEFFMKLNNPCIGISKYSPFFAKLDILPDYNIEFRFFAFLCRLITANLRKLCLYFFLILATGMVASCSSERNTWTSKAYHNTTAHFNGYYYANEEIRKIEGTIRKSQVDDYNGILRLFPTFDSALAKGYDKEVQEAVKMASLAIQRHPNSKWVDDAYILVGKARLYSLDWGNAIQTFKHVNTKSRDMNAKHLAIINLIRTYIEHKEFNNAQAAIDYLQKAELNRVNRKKFHLEKAYYYQLLNDYDNMVRNLTSADPLLKKNDRRGRIYFIIGQVYQELGFESEAYNYYKKCLSTNPEYEVDFYARLYMAQVTEISRSRDINTARKSFKKLLKDSKNKEFHDKIYYEMGIFELKQKNLNEAIENFNLSVRRGTNKKIDGEAYLRLGEIYYDTLRKYELSQAYYDSAITSLPADYEGYQAIKARQEILNEFVKHLKTIQWQDSLLTLSFLDSATIRARIDTVLTARKKAEASRASKKKKRSNRVEITSGPDNNIFSGNDNSENTAWYFGNPSAMGIGQTEFIRIWGNIRLEDNWRRSQRSTSGRSASPVTGDSTSLTKDTGNTSPGTVADPVDAEYNRITKEIPRTPEAKKEALSKIEEAYFRLGDIYYFKLQENENAAETYTTLLRRFPQTTHEPEVLYTLYLITKETDPAKAETYASLLKSKHPNSTFAKILINPAYLKESGLAIEKQKALYKLAYENFQLQDYAASRQTISEALAMGETSFTPSLNLLTVLITGETENISKYQYELDQFIKTYEGNALAVYAQKLLETSRKFQQTEEKRKGIQYVRSFEEPHYFVLVYKRAEKMDEIASAALENFNRENYKELNLKTSNLVFNDEYTLTFVADLPENSTAIAYYKTFIEKLSSITTLRNHKFNNFVITKDNFDIFYRTKGLDEYIQFFEKNYPAEGQ
jgi:tetratricopeptide (TPR) repeat protein